MNTLKACFYEQGTWPTIQQMVPQCLNKYKVNKTLTALFDSHCSHVEIAVFKDHVYFYKLMKPDVPDSV